MTTGIPYALYSTSQPPHEAGTGTVVAVSSTTLTILARGISFPAAYLESYANPVVGDLVKFSRQDASWVVDGKLAGVGTNQVFNFGFEQGAPATIPDGWILYSIAGAATAVGSVTGYAPEGVRELSVAAGGAAQDTYVYSQPISVVTGQQWAISALASANYPPATTPSATAQLYALWFANDTNLYPTTSAADTLVAQALNVGPDAAHSSVSGTVTVPAATSYLRVATRSVSAASIGVLWDAVIARRVG